MRAKWTNKDRWEWKTRTAAWVDVTWSTWEWETIKAACFKMTLTGCHENLTLSLKYHNKERIVITWIERTLQYFIGFSISINRTTENELKWTFYVIPETLGEGGSLPFFLWQYIYSLIFTLDPNSNNFAKWKTP